MGCSCGQPPAASLGRAPASRPSLGQGVKPGQGAKPWPALVGMSPGRRHAPLLYPVSNAFPILPLHSLAQPSSRSRGKGIASTSSCRGRLQWDTATAVPLGAHLLTPTTLSHRRRGARRSPHSRPFVPPAELANLLPSLPPPLCGQHPSSPAVTSLPTVKDAAASRATQEAFRQSSGAE